MNGAMIAGLVIAILLALSLTPLMVTVRSGAGKTRAWLWVGFLRFRLTDRPPKPGKEAKKRVKEEKPGEEPEGKLSLLQRYVTGKDDVFALIPMLSRLLKRALRAVRIGRLRLTVTVATDDAANTALWYGRANIAAGMLLPLLYEYVCVRNDRVRIQPDFQRNAPAYDLKVRVTTTPAALLALAACALFAVLKYWLPRRVKTEAVPKAAASI